MKISDPGVVRLPTPKAISPNDPDVQALFAEHAQMSAAMEKSLAEYEAEAKRNPDSDYAVFSKNGQVYAKVTKHGAVIIQDNSFDTATFRNRIASTGSISQVVDILQSMLGQGYKLSYPGQSGSPAATEERAGRVSLQRQMELLSVRHSV